MSAKSTTPVRYAEGTKVPVEQSAMEVEQLLTAHYSENEGPRLLPHAKS